MPFRVRQILSLAISILVACATAEVTLRCLDIAPCKTWNRNDRALWIELDPTAGWRNRPGTYTVRFDGAERGSTISISAIGARSFSPELQHPPDLLALLGDSYVFGYGLNDDETAASHLAALLPKQTVTNLGVAGYGTVNIVQRFCSSDRPAVLRDGTFVYLFNSFHVGRNIGDIRHLRLTTTSIPSLPIVSASSPQGFEIRQTTIEPARVESGKLRLLTLWGEFVALIESWRQTERAVDATVWAIDRLRGCLIADQKSNFIVALGDGERTILRTIGERVRTLGIPTIETTLPDYPTELRLTDGHPNAEGQQRLALEIANGLQQIRPEK